MLSSLKRPCTRALYNRILDAPGADELLLCWSRASSSNRSSSRRSSAKSNTSKTAESTEKKKPADPSLIMSQEQLIELKRTDSHAYHLYDRLRARNLLTSEADSLQRILVCTNFLH